jgi:hypothetical protein
MMTKREKEEYELEQKIFLRKNFIEVMGVAMRFYEKTGDKKFYEYAKWFGERARGL